VSPPTSTCSRAVRVGPGDDLADLLTLSFVVFTMWKLSPAMTDRAGRAAFVIVPRLCSAHVANSYRRIRVAIRINATAEHIVGIGSCTCSIARRKPRRIRRNQSPDMLAFKDTIVAYGWFYRGGVSIHAGAGGDSFVRRVLVEHGGSRSAWWWLSCSNTRFFRPIQD